LQHEDVRAALLEHQPLGTQISLDLPALTLAATYNWRDRHLKALQEPALRTLITERLARYRLSPTHLTAFLDVTQGGPEHFLVHHLLRFPQAMGADAAFGSAMHSTLEFLHMSVKQNSKATVAQATAFFEERLKTYRLPHQEYSRQLKRGLEAVAEYYKLRFKTFNELQIPESNFAHQGVVVNGARLSGKIDVLEIDTINKTAVVTDYKTGKSFANWHGSSDYDKHKLHKFQQQLAMYKLLVEGSRKYHDLQVSRGRIEFVEPNSHGQIDSLDFMPDKESLERLGLLVGRVWERIMNLDLPDTSHYPPNFKGVLAFEQDLLK
jgi:DNA helicase-2/ATP-dependent DNA helicase PcrA